MIIHILIDIPQKARRDNRHRPKRNTRIIHILIGLCIRQLPGPHHHLVRRLIPRDAGYLPQTLDQACPRQRDRLLDIRLILDPEFHQHRATDVFGGGGDEFPDEDVVVGGVADGAADDADGECEGRDGGDQVVGADDGGNDGGRDDDAADSEAGKDEKSPKRVEVVDAGAGKGGAA